MGEGWDQTILDLKVSVKTIKKYLKKGYDLAEEVLWFVSKLTSWTCDLIILSLGPDVPSFPSGQLQHWKN